jgi:alkyl sulfatase BDS1-like metallo-beta-lactamase superfamily hydrolase
MRLLSFPFAALVAALPLAAQIAELGAQDPTRDGLDLTEPIRVTENIWVAIGFGNTYLIKTAEGNVIIDTSLPNHAQRHIKMLKAVAPEPVRYIILTHGHGDHTGGIPLWREPDTKVIAQKNFAEFQHYQARLRGFFAWRNAAQFGEGIGSRAAISGPGRGNYPAAIAANVLFDQNYEFTLGGVKFEVHATPGETYDHASVWIPAWKVAFVGDNFYGSFPNIYTLRGTQPRWALDYVNSLNTVLAWKPEILAPSHGRPIQGNAAITAALTKYRDAILHVHDATVRGMNEGKDVFTLMREIQLPPELRVGEGYGTLAWSVRGIYEGYAGWFDGNPATMYATPPKAVYPDLVRLAGGAAKVAAESQKKLAEKKWVEALHLADIALAADPRERMALESRLAAFQALLKESRNSNERGWLEYGIRETKSRMQ